MLIEKTLTPVDVDRPSAFHTISRRGSGLNVLVAGDSPASTSSRETMVVGLPWSEYVARADATSRYAALAEYLSLNVVAPDNPGCGDDYVLDDESRKQLKSGDMSAASTLQLQESAPFLHGSLLFHGYSMGVLAVSAMLANAPQGITADRLILTESVAVTPSSKLKLASRFAREALRRQKYLAENPDWQNARIDDPESMKHMVTHGKANWAYAQLVARGTLLQNLRTARENGSIHDDTEVAVVHAEDSNMSTYEDNRQLETFFSRELGLSVVRRCIVRGESHSLVDSLPRYVSLVRQAIYI